MYQRHASLFILAFRQSTRTPIRQSSPEFTRRLIQSNSFSCRCRRPPHVSRIHTSRNFPVYTSPMYPCSPVKAQHSQPNTHSNIALFLARAQSSLTFDTIPLSCRNSAPRQLSAETANIKQCNVVGCGFTQVQMSIFPDYFQQFHHARINNLPDTRCNAHSPFSNLLTHIQKSSPAMWWLFLGKIESSLTSPTLCTTSIHMCSRFLHIFFICCACLPACLCK
jgi:hypothetical protein